jgi:hypothetical protein
MHTQFLLESLNERDCLGYLGVDGRIFKFILEKQDVIMWTRLNRSTIESNSELF